MKTSTKLSYNSNIELIPIPYSIETKIEKLTYSLYNSVIIKVEGHTKLVNRNTVCYKKTSRQ